MIALKFKIAFESSERSQRSIVIDLVRLLLTRFMKNIVPIEKLNTVFVITSITSNRIKYETPKHYEFMEIRPQFYNTSHFELV